MDYSCAEQSLFDHLRPVLKRNARTHTLAELEQATLAEATWYVAENKTSHLFSLHTLETKTRQWANYWHTNPPKYDLQQQSNGGKKAGAIRHKEKLHRAVKAVLMRREGYTTQQIAQALHVSERTLERYWKVGQSELQRRADRRERKRERTRKYYLGLSRSLEEGLQSLRIYLDSTCGTIKEKPQWTKQESLELTPATDAACPSYPNMPPKNTVASSVSRPTDRLTVMPTNATDCSSRSLTGTARFAESAVKNCPSTAEP